MASSSNSDHASPKTPTILVGHALQKVM